MYWILNVAIARLTEGAGLLATIKVETAEKKRSNTGARPRRLLHVCLDVDRLPLDRLCATLVDSQINPNINPNINTNISINTNMAQHSSPPDRAKRTANRLAQQKFRRQRKDYIAQLETELAMCRAGASEELVQRRQQVEQLAAEKKILRDMLIKVAHSLGNACGLDVTLTPRQPDGTDTCALAPQTEDERHDESDNISNLDPVASVDDGQDKIEGNLQINTVVTDEDNNSMLRGPTFDLFESAFDWLPSTGDHDMDAGPGTLLLSPAPNNVWPSIPGPLFSPPPAPAPAPADKAQLACIMFRRQVDHVLDSCLAALESGTDHLELFENRLVQGVVHAIFQIQEFTAGAFQMKAMSLSGGAAWLLWHVVKRLRDALVSYKGPVSVEDILVNLAHRLVPTGAPVDRVIQPDVTILDIRPMFSCKEERTLKSEFYSALSMYKLRPASIVPDEVATSYLVDHFFEQMSVL
ncbi:hypothetical protein SNOG_15389 [Parastagonospora nodorum SN15]|uniref:BZIP domain-containing protein n=1 Tax=Phaeosphaeria nodorum (strain SN15 / ATCC MYA-4574 / FGSC 10173) TaxID=321614 RepID=Q0TYW9_PHANO|nr:hypothetical protein SNOG_15389 [Parastagonospora nodorum SN15]EAT77322.2 hypothetical protein SNOG_15389 [Parastagonospora nodorum SN15]